MRRFDTRYFPFITYCVLLFVLLFFTMKTDFNLIGYSYYMDNHSNVLTIEEGVWEKESHSIEVAEDNAIHVLQAVLPITQANNLWKVNVFLISLFASGFFVLFNKFLMSKKFLKWYAAIYFLCLIVFVVWDSISYKEIMKDIAQYTTKLLE
ncbi:hypothetical protein [Cytobacillus massiliigabonensis]|uniref:hypothetical protein n=1 Tax=Cytobacillus massiliigabonensis TaxID=1871011 RepID=UPI000C850778|nr:hypothetical protein [Cytobacillus massiliigabonensis]